ncbi:hypothetical protein LTR35_009278 [Friedmanniomyces endolithicus]|uniref:F-box domain-containing protein n=1 Tax=Friedmanniomyces endolithicus TaxID=329885 RepID=A0AAN6FL98_9PEZI|nr:hypothetical protein LTR35_009278 [Friedmanniomyces endolithicus]KAK0292338.1 hypothetical protein LTS00_008173 [Friedmanniomyces endolithicus]KAK0320334.1 hypothetical protein LTR82_008851 [Friedmanniomyces endolithicus]KAK0993712.1 hypothetical protein LTR54_011004 [Friedmanniomyces endolithicus]
MLYHWNQTPSDRLRRFNAITKQSFQDSESGAWSTVSIFDPPFKPVYLSNGWTRKTLAPYAKRKFGVLYGERKYAHKYPSKPLRFLDFPPEIRNQIYGQLLDFDYIELAPLNTVGKSNGLVRIRHMRYYKRTIVPRIRLLRANKQIHAEASPIFYGQNEFRFTNFYGFDTFTYFCRTIGRSNTALLRKITECYPKPPSRAGIRSDGMMHRSNTAWDNFEWVMTSKMGMRKCYHRWHKFTLERTKDITAVNSGLQQYRLVIADEHDLDDDFDIRYAGGLLGRLSAQKLEGIKTQLVLLHPAEDVTLLPEQGRIVVLEQVVEHVERNGFEVVHATYDAIGQYEVRDETRDDVHDGDEDYDDWIDGYEI